MVEAVSYTHLDVYKRQVLPPESELVPQLTTEAQKAEVEAYLDRTKKRTERERIADRRVTGVFLSLIHIFSETAQVSVHHIFSRLFSKYQITFH